MYYLEDNHPEYEYSCYIRVGSAKPYIAPYVLYDMTDIYRVIEEIERKHNRYHQAFYIDNDFYDNHYNKIENGTYYRFMKRKVNNWTPVRKEKYEKVLSLVK